MTNPLTREQIEAMRESLKKMTGDWCADPDNIPILEAKIDALCDLALIGLDAEAMAQAAQAEAFEKAAAEIENRFVNPSNLYGVIDAIRALTPASGPWQRVPESHVVVPKEPTLEMLKAGAIAFYDSKQDVLAARLPEAYRAMLAEVKK